jgi:hypothetical protein
MGAARPGADALDACLVVPETGPLADEPGPLGDWGAVDPSAVETGMGWVPFPR